MMQVPCEAPPTEQYSLVRDCDNCKEAYKRWLCTVAIPRCEDYSSTNSNAMIRNVGKPFPNGTMAPDDDRERLESKKAYNNSRNSFIDEEIGPGPYKEVLPCDELCYEVVRSCPASLEFGCPRPGMIGFEWSYGREDEDRDQDESPSCNFPGKTRTFVSLAGALLPPISVFTGLGLAGVTLTLL